MNRTRYPSNWSQLARTCKLLAQWRCEHCGIKHGETAFAHSGQPYVIHLHAAHLDHDPANPHPRLRALCPTCHGLYDWHAREREACVRLERLKHQVVLAQKGRGR